jgi:peptide/nickel transport system permease protein
MSDDRSRTASKLKTLSHKCVLLLAGLVLLIFVVVAVFAPILAPSNLVSVDLSHTFANPAWAGGTWAHPLGTDQLGHDVLTQLMYGARTSLTTVVWVILITSSFGTLMGLIAGYAGGVADIIISRASELAYVMPQIIVGLVLAVALGRGGTTVIIVLSVVGWVFYARVVRAEVVTLKGSDFVALATVAGVSFQTILRRHLLPAVIPSILALATLDFGNVILYEAGLSFIGLGVQPPNASWGLMISTNRVFLSTHPLLLVLPSAALVMTTLSGHILGDSLRERLDPRMRSIVEGPRSLTMRRRSIGTTAASGDVIR